MVNKTTTVMICLTFLLIFCSAAVAGNINATTDDGRAVVLYPDGKWTYRKDDVVSMPDAKSMSKQIVRGRYGTYGLQYNGNLWKLHNKTTNTQAEFRFWHADGDVYAMILAERIEVSLEALRNIALQNTLKVAPDARIVFEQKKTVHGKDILCIKMEATVSGIPFTYLGYYYSGPAGSIQIITYTGRNLFSQYEKDMTDFLDGFIVYK